jgi:hypothetical protein
MATTPEGRVKRKVDTYLGELNYLLTEAGINLYTIKYVPTGYGSNNQLDYTLCVAGHFVVIETKAPGEWLTPLQIMSCVNAFKAGATVFIISGDEGLGAFKNWVRNNERYWNA